MLIFYQYYHNATNPGILAPGGARADTHIFTRKRNSSDFWLPDGNYKKVVVETENVESSPMNSNKNKSAFKMKGWQAK